MTGRTRGEDDGEGNEGTPPHRAKQIKLKAVSRDTAFTQNSIGISF